MAENRTSFAVEDNPGTWVTCRTRTVVTEFRRELCLVIRINPLVFGQRAEFFGQPPVVTIAQDLEGTGCKIGKLLAR